MEIVIEHPKHLKAYRVGYDSARQIAAAVGSAIVEKRSLGGGGGSVRYVIMTKSGPKTAVIGDWIVCLGPENFDVCMLSEFHEKYVLLRAVSQGRRVHRSAKPRKKWTDYIRPDEDLPR